MYENTIRDMRIEASLVAVTEQAKYLKEENKKMKKLQKENNNLTEKLSVLHGYLSLKLVKTHENICNKYFLPAHSYCTFNIFYATYLL